MTSKEILMELRALQSKVDYHPDRHAGGFVDLADIAAKLLHAAHDLLAAHDQPATDPARAERVRQAKRFIESAQGDLKGLPEARRRLAETIASGAVTPPLRQDYFGFVEHL